jgi:hypothetical protein
MADDAPISTATNLTANPPPIIPQEASLPQTPTPDDLASWNGGCLYVPHNPTSFTTNVPEQNLAPQGELLSCLTRQPDRISQQANWMSFQVDASWTKTAIHL